MNIIKFLAKYESNFNEYIAKYIFRLTINCPEFDMLNANTNKKVDFIWVPFQVVNDIFVTPLNKETKFQNRLMMIALTTMITDNETFKFSNRKTSSSLDKNSIII